MVYQTKLKTQTMPMLKYIILLLMILITSLSFAQESEQLYPDTLLLRLIKEKKVKQVDIIDATNKGRTLQTTHYNANGDEVLLMNFQNGYSYFQPFEGGKLRKKLIYSTLDTKDTLNAEDKYIHWFDELGNLTREDNIMYGKLFQTTEHTVKCSGDTCLLTERKSDGRYSSIRVIKNGKMEWIDYISYNKYEQISEVKSFYRMYNSHYQLIEEGNRFYDDTLEAYLIEKKFHLAELFNNDTLSRIILSGKLKPRYICKKKYQYTNQLLDSIQEGVFTVKHITYNSHNLPIEVSCRFVAEEYKNEEASCGKTIYLYNDINLPTTVIVYHGDGKEQSRISYKYYF